MPNPWMPGLRHDPGAAAHYALGTNSMWMMVDHWTAGVNSYGICKDDGLCQILLPKVGVPWQFAEINAKCYHAGSKAYGDYNGAGPGLEVERFANDPLSPDQKLWLGRINAWCASEWGLSNVHYWGPRFPWHQASFHGSVNHRDVHPNDDGISREEWDSLTAPATPIKKDDDPMLYVFNPSAPTEIWCLAGNTRRHVSPDEWLFAAFVGTKAIKVSAAWFNSYPEVN